MLLNTKVCSFHITRSWFRGTTLTKDMYHQQGFWHFRGTRATTRALLVESLVPCTIQVAAASSLLRLWICDPSNSTGGTGITSTFLESISTGSDFASISACHFLWKSHFSPDECPDISSRSGRRIRLRFCCQRRTRMPPNTTMGKTAPMAMPVFTPVCMPEEEPVADVSSSMVASIALARLEAHALGERDRSLDCRYTTTGTAKVVPLDRCCEVIRALCRFHRLATV
jgi:hypothetical protein